MTKEQTCDVLSLIYAIYPRAYERQGLEATNNAWNLMFEREQFEVVIGAVKRVLRTSKFAPTIAEVSAEIARYKDGLKARLNQYNYYFGAMPGECKECGVKNRIEIVMKCGARKCPKEISNEERGIWYLTESQVRQIKAILNEGER